MLNKEIPFIRICLPLCAGIISGLYIEPGSAFIIFAVFVSTGFILNWFFKSREVSIIYGFSLTVSLFASGLLLYNYEKKSISKLEPEQSLFACTLSDYPVEKTNSYLLTVKLNGKITGNRPEPVRGSLLLYYRKDSLVTKLLPGDLLIIRCTPVLITSRGNPFEFDYRFFLENQGIRYYAYASHQNLISHTTPDYRKLIHKALIIREKIIRMYEQRGITGDRLALVAAITLGQKSMLDADQKIYFIKAGVMHIMAVSGLHTVILSLFVFNVLFFLKRRFNILRILITLVFLWSFAYVTGLTPSVLRATLMFTFLQAGTLLKRPVNGINSVLASGFVLILIHPSVIFDAGFLLSYSAVIYIIAFYRELYQKFEFKNQITDKIWQSAAVTIVAQAGTLPLTISLFNRFPTYFILTNIIIVPLSSVLVINGCLVPMLFPVKFLSLFLAMILNNLTGLTEFLTRMASSLPFASIEQIGMTNAECVFFTIAVFLLTFYFLKRKSMPLIWPLAAIVGYLLTGTIVEISTRRTNDLIVYNTTGCPAIGIRTGKILNLYSDTTIAGAEVKRHCSTLGLKMRLTRISKGGNCIKAGNTTIVITQSLSQNVLDNFAPDIVILIGSRPEVVCRDRAFLSSIDIIAADGVPVVRSGGRNKSVAPLTVFLVRKSGAFTRRL